MFSDDGWKPGLLKAKTTALLLSVSLSAVVYGACVSAANSTAPANVASSVAAGTPEPAPSVIVPVPTVDVSELPPNAVQDKNGFYHQYFVGLYKNEEYNYAVQIPRGKRGLSTLPPLPQHGFVVHLTPDESRRIEVFANYVSNQKSLEEAVEAVIEVYKEIGYAAVIPERKIGRAGGLPAVYFQAEGKPAKDDESTMGYYVIIQGGDGETSNNIVHELRLRTVPSEFEADKKVFDRVVSSWRVLKTK